MSTKTRPAILDLDAADLERLLDRIGAQISPEDHASLHDVVRTLFTLTSLLRDSRTTIARLRGMLGWSSSEKTADVCGDSSLRGDDSQVHSSEDGATASPTARTPAPAV